ncbi:MAG: hypothetical protein IKX96_03590, partial [Firmicutes bacterium]|nr:hypothetical protein [Bacillota bacterium]
GDIPKAVLNLLDISMIHNRASRLGIRRIVKQSRSLIFVFEKDSLKPEAISALIDAYDTRVGFLGSDTPRLSLELEDAPAAQEALNVIDLMYNI